MHNILRIFLPLCCFVLVGCSLMPNEMKSAEQIMETSPDSALHILQHIQNVNAMSDGDRALYGLLYFQALDKNNKPLKPDSLIKFSLNYYQNHNDNIHLASCYYYKAKRLKFDQRFEDATLLYLKALDIIQNKRENYLLLGKIYSDMGEISIIQHDYDESLTKFQLSVDCFRKAKNTIEASYRVISIGKVYHFQKDYRKAQRYYKQALLQTPDSFLQGFAFQEIGINYYWAKQYDSAQYFLQKSLRYPYKGTNYAIRCINISDIFFDREQYDSAFHYANKALKYPSTFFNQRDCYRILANTECSRGDFKKVGFYMSKYQACTDSVRKVETQTKSTVLENLYQTNGTASKTKKYLLLLGCIIPIIVIISLFIVYRLRNRNKGKEKELEEAEVQIIHKQSLLIDGLLQNIQEMRNSQAVAYKKASQVQREQMDKNVYSVCLYVNDWNAFKKLMNRTFNNIVSEIEESYKDVTHKEIIWSCLFLLDIPNPDMALILDSQPGSLYKLKQRLTQKMNLNSTKELDKFLQRFSEKR